MPNSADVLSWSTLTPAVNEMKRPNDFLKNVVFGRSQAMQTRDIELSFLDRGRKIAPFVERDGEAIMTSGRDETFRVITPPHIRIKRPMTPSELLTKRRPGSVIFPGQSGLQRAMREYIASELQMLMDDVMNAEELLCAQALRGAVSYSVADEASFTITFPRLASHSITLAGQDQWETGSGQGTSSSPRKDFLTAAQLINDAVSLNVTDVVLGSEAADAFLAHTELDTKLDTRRLRTGSVDLTAQFQESGAMLLGEYVHGIRVWRYARQVDVGGVATDLIRPKYAEFIANSPQAQFVTYYGAIEDMRAIGEGRVLASPRFSKSWDQEDPSRRLLLVESNPMPVMRRPNATVSMKVVA